MAQAGATRGNLPAELTSFVGRDADLAQVGELLAGSRLLTLTGVGGVGKTRLALRAAAGLRHVFRDGVWLVEFDRLHDAALVPQAVAAVLGMQERAGYTGTSALGEYVADRQLMLVLDNCEHLVHAVADLVTELLAAGPRLRVLATSREPLGVPQETVLSVAPLLTPDGHEELAARRLADFPAVSLFLQRAGDVVPGFRLTDDNMSAVAQICHQVEGLPLAIELATAQLRTYSPERINELMSDRFSLLTRGSRARSARMQTLRASIGWSYELCSAPEQELWARISVFSGGFELDAVQGVCAGDDLPAGHIPDLVAALVAKSVLIPERSGSVTRYRLLEAVRQYGEEHLRDSGQYRPLRRRHRDWYEQLTAAANADWLSPRQVDWMVRLDREHANVQLALDFCIAERGNADVALRMLNHSWHFYYWNFGYIGEGRYRFTQALAQAPESTAERARALLVVSVLTSSLADRSAARVLLQEGQRLAAELDDPATSGIAAFAAGNVAIYGGDVSGAIADYERGLEAVPPGLDDIVRADLLLCAVIAVGVTGDEDRAMAMNRELLALTESHGEFFHHSYALWTLGLSCWRQRHLVRATELEQQSLRLRRRLKDRIGTTLTLEALAWVAATEGRNERAAVLLGAAGRLWRLMAISMDAYGHLVGYQQECLRATRAALGEVAFGTAFDRGMAMSTKDAVAYALRADLVIDPGA
jgi:predicted ATPase